MRLHPKAARRQGADSALCGWKTQDTDDAGIEQWSWHCRSERRSLGKKGLPFACGTYLHVQEVRCSLLTKTSAGQRSGLAKQPEASGWSECSDVRFGDSNDSPGTTEHATPDSSPEEDQCCLPTSKNKGANVEDLVNIRSSKGLSPVAHQVLSPDLRRTKRLLNLSHRTTPTEQGPKREDLTQPSSSPPLSLEALGLTSLLKDDSFRGGHRDVAALRVTAGELMRASHVVKARSQACSSVAMALNLATLTGWDRSSGGSRPAEERPGCGSPRLPPAPVPTFHHQPLHGRNSTQQQCRSLPDISSVASPPHEHGPHLRLHDGKAAAPGAPAGRRGTLKYASRGDGGRAGGPSEEKAVEALRRAQPSATWRETPAACRGRKERGGGDGGNQQVVSAPGEAPFAEGRTQAQAAEAKQRPLQMPLELPPVLQWQTTGSLVHLQRTI
ncbi:uncharacterized protein LOC144733382 [Lampetra planeri]